MIPEGNSIEALAGAYDHYQRHAVRQTVLFGKTYTWIKDSKGLYLVPGLFGI